MGPKVRGEGRYRFQGFELDLSTVELRDRDGARVALTPLAFQLLAHLVEHRERVIAKDELFEVLWSDVVATDNSLSQAVWAVRRALGDTGGAQRLIKNVRGRGYRFVADVERIELDASPTAAKTALTADAGEPPMVGRDRELAQLTTSLDAASSGRGRALLISGGPGIGKTRLCAELRARAELAGMRVYEGRCVDNEAMPSFWPFQQVARALVRDYPPERLHELVDGVAGELVKLIPELREGVPDLTSAPERDLPQQRFQLFDALAVLFARASAQAPLVVVLDDLHWADDSTLLCLEFLAPAIARLPLLLAIAHREDPARPALQRSLSALERQSDGAVLGLVGLEQAQTGRLLELHGGGEPPDAALVRRVHELTAGNPFMVIQLARWLSLQPVAARAAEIALPPQARAPVEQQIAALPQPTQELLRLCAVLGQPFHLGDVRRASGLRAEVVLDALEPAIAARLVKDEGAAGHVFGHPTIRTLIYEALSRGQRTRLHGQIGEAIAEADGDDTSPRLGELAHHFYEAAASGHEGRAVRYCMLAAERAYEATAYEEAAAQYRRALSVLDLSDGADEALRCRLLLGLGRSLRGTPEPIQAIKAVFAEAARRARAIDDTQLLCEAAMCHAGRGPRRVGALGEAGTLDLADVEWLELALSRLEPGPSQGRALVEAQLAYALYHSDRSAERRTLARHAVEVARQVGDPAVLAECLMLGQAAVRGPSDLEARMAALGEIIDLARDAGLRGLQLDAHDERAWSCFEAGDLEGAELHLQSVVRLVEELRQPRERRALTAWRVLRLDGEGRFDEAQKVFEEAQAAAPWKRSGDRLDQGAAIRGFMVSLFRGCAQAMIPGIEAYAEKFPLPVAWHCGMVSMYAAAGRVADARRELDRLAAGEFACIPDDHNWIVSHALLANACRLMDDARHAQILYERLSRYPDRVMFVGLHGFCAGPLQRALGELALVQGDFDRAERHLQLAIARATQSGMPIWTAWCRLLYAEVLLRRGGRDSLERAYEQLMAGVAFARERQLTFLVEWGERLREPIANRTSPRRSARSD